MPGTILGAQELMGNHTTGTLPSWSLQSSRRKTLKQKMEKKHDFKMASSKRERIVFCDRLGKFTINNSVPLIKCI